MDAKGAGAQAHAAGYGVYLSVWLALVALLAITVAVAKFRLTAYSVPVNLGISSIKAGLVLLFFMHLRNERIFLKAVVVLAIATLFSIIALTFADTWYR